MSNTTVVNEGVQVTALVAIDELIETLAASETITKATLSALSRDILTYITLNGSNDIAVANRTIDVLTPMNKKAAGLFFSHFLPWKFDVETMSFGGALTKERAIEAKNDATRDFLANPANDIWTWAEDNITIKPREAFADRIQAVIKQALDGIKDTNEREGLQALSQFEILQAVMAGGVDADALAEAFAVTEVPVNVGSKMTVAEFGYEAKH